MIAFIHQDFASWRLLGVELKKTLEVLLEVLTAALAECQVADGRGFEPRVPFGTHAFQACTIDRSVTHPFLICSGDRRTCRRKNNATVIDRRYRKKRLKLQPPEQFVERQLNADVKFTEVRVFGAHRVEAHLVN